MAATALAVIVAACSSTESPDPTPSPVSEPPPTAETLVVGVHLPDEQALGSAFGLIPSDLPLYSLHPNGSLWDGVVGQFVYSGVYRLDATQSPVPDLAEAPCAVSSDLLVITCSLREASFHDGTPLTADDVAYTYQLLLSEACRLPICVSPDLERFAAATALDERTVEFRLAEPDPAFTTVVLPGIRIEPRARVERAFAQFVEAADGADPASLAALSSRVAPLSPNGLPECAPSEEALLAEAEVAIADMGIVVRSRDAYATGRGGASDECAYFEYLGRVLTDASDALNLTGIDATAASYAILEHPTPVGSGP